MPDSRSTSRSTTAPLATNAPETDIPSSSASTANHERLYAQARPSQGGKPPSARRRLQRAPRGSGRPLRALSRNSENAAAAHRPRPPHRAGTRAALPSLQPDARRMGNARMASASGDVPRLEPERSDGRPVNRCPYCGYRCQGRVCRYCKDLPALDPNVTPVLRSPVMLDDSAPPMRVELREAVKAAREREDC